MWSEVQTSLETPRKEAAFHFKWHGPQNPQRRLSGRRTATALVRVTAAARGNTSGRHGRGGGWLRRKYQLPIARAVTFSVILLPLRRETHRAAGRWWNNAALFRNTPHCYSQSSAVKCRRAGSFKATEEKLFICSFCKTTVMTEVYFKKKWNLWRLKMHENDIFPPPHFYSFRRIFILKPFF